MKIAVPDPIDNDIFLRTQQVVPRHWPVQGNVLHGRLSFDVLASFSAKRFDVNVVDRIRTEHFLAADVDVLALDW